MPKKSKTEQHEPRNHVKKSKNDQHESLNHRKKSENEQHEPHNLMKRSQNEQHETLNLAKKSKDKQHEPRDHVNLNLINFFKKRLQKFPLKPTFRAKQLSQKTAQIVEKCTEYTESCAPCSCSSPLKDTIEPLCSTVGR